MKAAGSSRWASRRPDGGLARTTARPVMSTAVGSISVAVGGPAEVWRGALGVDGPGGGRVPAVLVDELGERPAAHRPVVPGGPAERDGGGDGDLVRDARAAGAARARRTACQVVITPP